VPLALIRVSSFRAHSAAFAHAETAKSATAAHAACFFIIASSPGVREA